jgi:predicted aspartyl protease
MELAISVDNGDPLVAVKINGQEDQFVVDSGSAYSVIEEHAAQNLHLPIHTASSFAVAHAFGIGGNSVLHLAVAKNFEFAGVHTSSIQMLMRNDLAGRHGAIGNDLLGNFDVEYDLAKSRMGLFKTSGCANAEIAFWKQSDQQASTIEFTAQQNDNVTTGSLVGMESSRSPVIAVIYLNGTLVRGALDTAARSSLVDKRVAERVGARIASEASDLLMGVRLGSSKSYVAQFDSVALGNREEIKNTHVRVAESLPYEMVLGSDFFLSHHVFVSRTDRKIFLTYNGGSVFNVSREAERRP